MNNLLKTEWLKIRKYRAFWWLFVLTALSYPGINYIFYRIYLDITSDKTDSNQMVKMLLGNPFEFPEAWHTVAFFSSLFVIIPAVLVIMFITNEYNYKTHRQNIIDGWSRDQFLAAKMINVLVTSLIVTLLYIVVSVITGMVNTEGSINPLPQSYYIGLFALQTFSQLSIAFLIGFLVRKAFISLGIFLFYFLIFEPILAGLLKWKVNDIGRFLPLEISDRMIPVPAFLGKFDQKAYDQALRNINLHVLLTIILTALIWFICFRINRRRDL